MAEDQDVVELLKAAETGTDFSNVTMTQIFLRSARLDALKQGGKKLQARNSHQVLGDSLRDPVAFVVCWTTDGAETLKETGRHTGGTGQAIRLADACNIPVFNLCKMGAEERLWAFLGNKCIETYTS